MVQFNFFRREVNCKIVYYGPGLSGKTTNLEIVHQKTPSTNRGELTSISTEQDRTLFFDFMPIDLGTVGGMKTKLRLFTVPGQNYYNSTRKLVLQGADGVIFVADSRKEKMDENLESLKNLEENLAENGIKIRDIPLIIQWNKRDLPTALPVDELEKKVNYLRVPTVEAVAYTGQGVFPTLKKCAELVLSDIDKKQKSNTLSPEGSQNQPKPAFAPGISKTSVPGAPKPIAKSEPFSGLKAAPQKIETPQPVTHNPETPRGGEPVGAGSAGKPLFKKFKKFLDKENG